MNHTIKALLLITTFIFCHYMMKEFWGDNWVSVLSDLDQQSALLLFPAKYLFIYGPLLVVATLLFKHESWYNVLGVDIEGFQRYLLAAVVCYTYGDRLRLFK